jgi:hypothetical protein
MNPKVLIPAVGVVAIVAAFYFLVFAPKREEVARLDKAIAKQSAAAVQAEQLAASYAEAKLHYGENYTTIARLGKAVPADDDVRSLIVQLDSAAKRSKVSFRGVALTVGGVAVVPGAAGAAASPGLAPAPGAVPVGSAGFSAMPFAFTFSGDFFRLSDFFRRLERFVTVENNRIDVTGRLLLLGSIAVTADATDVGKLEAKVGAATYIVPPPQEVTGEPVAAPAGTPAATPTVAGGAIPKTTATIRGAR